MAFKRLLCLFVFSFAAAVAVGVTGRREVFAEAGSVVVPVTDQNIVYSPYNWYKSGAVYAQSPNPGAYLRLSFSGMKIAVNMDVSPLTGARVPASQYPLVRYSVDGKPSVTVQLTPTTRALSCAVGLPSGTHTLLLQYVAGYVFLDFWTPVNVLRVTGFTLDDGASTVTPLGIAAPLPKNALFLGDSITNGDNTIATFAAGITNAVETQDATVGYAPVVAAGIGAEYGIVAYGGASWDRAAADGHTPGLMTFATLLDSVHSRLVGGKLAPAPDDIFINMGENAGPGDGDVPALLETLRAASRPATRLFVIVPFSGRARAALTAGVQAYQSNVPSDANVFLIDLGNNPYLTDAGPTMLAVDGQHPLAALDALLGAQIVQSRAILIQQEAARHP